MCNCANRLRSFMTSNGFVKEGSTWKHPNGQEFSDREVSSRHSAIMVRLMRDKAFGRLQVSDA